MKTAKQNLKCVGGFVLKYLKNLYPIWLSLYVFLPTLLGISILSWDEHTSGFPLVKEYWSPFWLSYNLILIPLIVTLCQIFRSKILYKIIVLYYLLAGIVEITHWIVMRQVVNPQSILIILGTHTEEATSFMDLHLQKIWVVLGVLAIHIYLFKKVLQEKIYKHNVNYVVIFNTVLLGIVLSFIYRDSQKKYAFFIRGDKPPSLITASLGAIWHLNQQKNITKLKTVSVQQDSKTKESTFIVVIGESLSKNHMSLYGYHKNTNPLLTKRKDIFVFKDVLSKYSYTLAAVSSILNLKDIIARKEVTKAQGTQGTVPIDENLKHQLAVNVDLIDIFKSAGYKTYWLSSQRKLGIFENLITNYAKKCDVQQFISHRLNHEMELVHDEELLPYLKKTLQEKYAKKFIVVHMNGSHAPYKIRYPKNYQVFKAGKNKKETAVANYDNSVLYNDSVINALLEIVQKNTSGDNATSLIYTSDHGENVFDDLNSAFDVGHGHSSNTSKTCYEIPFIVWLSKAYRDQSPTKIQTLENNLNKPFITSQLFHSILDLNHIDYDSLESSKSIFSASYQASIPRILESGKPYESK